MNVMDVERLTFQQMVRLPEVGQWFMEAGDPLEYEVPDVPGAIYCAAYDEGTLLMAAAQPLNSSAMHVHVAAHPERRQNTVRAAKAALEHIRSVAGHETAIFALTPSDNKPALALARLVGMKRCGTLHGAYRRRFVRGDLVIHEVS